LSFILMTDSNSEITYQMADRYDIKCILMPYSIDGEEIDYDLGRNTDFKGFFQRMREGAKVTTYQRNPQDFLDFWRPFMEQGQDVLYIAFSSRLSGTFDSATMAKMQLLEEFPERRIELVDTLAISFPEGQLVYHAAKMREQGASLDEIKDWVEQNKFHAVAYFTVEDLVYLKRGGRISGTSAAMGSLLDIKPMLHVSMQGTLEPIEKIKGRKKSVKRLLEMIEVKKANEEFPITIKHADAIVEAQYMESYIKEKYNFSEVLIHDVGPVIGSHSGPGTLAIIFMSKETR
jgi:DegV family protein with EDD domain